MTEFQNCGEDSGVGIFISVRQVHQNERILRGLGALLEIREMK